ncbi:MAG: FAD-linked oxidase C-terminal domain-containing protein [Rhodospirillaceae bacterium]
MRTVEGWPAAARALAERFGERFSTGAALCEQHGHDESHHKTMPPDGVVFPQNTEEVAAAVHICARERVPMVPFGAGTSLEGGVAAVRGGLCLDLSRMNRIVRVGVDDLDVTVEAGVTRKQLNEYLRDTGQFFPVDPGADATLGGMAATRASGTNAVRYGTMRENVLGLTVVLADGRVIRPGGRARKSAAGYDLTRLFVGSEGTLGVITEVTLRLYGIPEAISVAVCSFKSVADAVSTVIATIQLGIPIARMELLDARAIAAVNAYSKLDLSETPTLFLEFHGSDAAVAEQSKAVSFIAGEFHGSDFQWAMRPEERTRLWQARHNAYYAAMALRPGARGFSTDVCVPISALAECIAETRADLSASTALAPLIGHVGDGNFHLIFVVHPEDEAQMAEAHRLNDRLVQRALAFGGTCTGEHGVGLGKCAYLVDECGEETINVMRSIKQSLDPHNLMNPGKVVAV